MSGTRLLSLRPLGRQYDVRLLAQSRLAVARKCAAMINIERCLFALYTPANSIHRGHSNVKNPSRVATVSPFSRPYPRRLLDEVWLVPSHRLPLSTGRQIRTQTTNQRAPFTNRLDSLSRGQRRTSPSAPPAHLGRYRPTAKSLEKGEARMCLRLLRLWLPFAVSGKTVQNFINRFTNG